MALGCGRPTVTLLLRPKLRTVISTLPMRIGAIVWKSSVPLRFLEVATSARREIRCKFGVRPSCLCPIDPIFRNFR